MKLYYPSCRQALIQPETGKSCPHCGARYQLVACCPQCDKPVEELKACGAVNYFCQHGHGLISKQRVLWQTAAD